MIIRNIYQTLLKWKEDPKKKPLILRGARQVGKTFLVDQLAHEFENYVSLSFERMRVRQLWAHDPSMKELLASIEVFEGKKITPGKTLLFLDEIQNEPKAIQSLRYFYEEIPHLHVIATGSLLEVTLKNKGFSFPVGRVSFLYLYPANFFEFLKTMEHENLAEELSHLDVNHPLNPALHEWAMDLFQEYSFVGGMPEVVQNYSGKKDFLSMVKIKEGLIQSFEEDVPKYCRPHQYPHVQLLIHQAPLFAGQRIQYGNFAHSGHGSREMRMAFDLLEKAMVIQRIKGSPSNVLPPIPHERVSPKLLYLDSGLIAHRLNIDPVSFKTIPLEEHFRGTFAEAIVGQELLAQNIYQREVPLFWYRDKPGADAEVDFMIIVKGLLIPIEVKSGKTGSLRSLLQFMETAPHPYAVRIYSGPLQLDTVKTPQGKTFQLLSLPFYLLSWIREILEKWIQ